MSRMAQIRKHNTKPEMALRRALWRRGYRYRLHADLPGTPDIVFPSPKVAVMVDGCFWHGCPDHYRRPPRNHGYWVPKLERNRARDRRVNRALREMGWTVVRIWEHEIHDDLEAACTRVEEALVEA